MFTPDQLISFSRADISVAVSTPTGLITPIVTGADTKSLSAISTEMKDLAAPRARQQAEARGISRAAPRRSATWACIGIKQFEAVINPPQGMILAVGAGEKRPLCDRRRARRRDGDVGDRQLRSPRDRRRGRRRADAGVQGAGREPAGDAGLTRDAVAGRGRCTSGSSRAASSAALTAAAAWSYPLGRRVDLVVRGGGDGGDDADGRSGRCGARVARSTGRGRDARCPTGAPTIRVTAMPADANPYGDIFGGWLMGQMDWPRARSRRATRGGRAVTIAVDAMKFHAPVHRRRRGVGLCDAGRGRAHLDDDRGRGLAPRAPRRGGVQGDPGALRVRRDRRGAPSAHGCRDAACLRR